MKQKTLLITETTHVILKNYCKTNSLKINNWVENLIIEEIKKQNNAGK